jgi:chromate transporter
VPTPPATPSERPQPEAPGDAGGGQALEVLLAFLRLGLTSFGGPVAHLGYFRTEFVERRRWLDDRSYSDLVTLCQFLPGPASSQVGMALGLSRAGWAGALMAWLGFTLPSALALIAFAYGIARWGDLAASGAVQGLKVAAVAVVAQAVWGMARSLCPDRPRAGLAIFAALLTLALPSAIGQVGAIVACGLIGWRLVQVPHQQPAAHAGHRVSRGAGVAALTLLLVLLAGLPLVAGATGSMLWMLVDGFFRAGALVFGGGHVVLPLLQATVVPGGAVSNADFLAGYGAAQAVPGPLFTFAAYLGTVAASPLQGWAGGLVFLVVIFVPAFLLLVAAWPFWDQLRQRDAVQSAMAGVNAGVVGILLSALYDPVWISAIHGSAEFGIALAAFGLLVHARVSPVFVVALSAAAGWALL